MGIFLLLTAIVCYLGGVAGFLYWWRNGRRLALYSYSFKERFDRRRAGSPLPVDWLRTAVLTGFLLSAAASTLLWMITNRTATVLQNILMVAAVGAATLSGYGVSVITRSVQGWVNPSAIQLRRKLPIYFETIQDYRVINRWGRSLLILDIGGDTPRRETIPLWRCSDPHLFAGLVNCAVQKTSASRQLQRLDEGTARALEKEILYLQSLFEVKLIEASNSFAAR